jgi:hypothetical protein
MLFDVIRLLDERLDKFLKSVLEFMLFSVSFRASETRSWILDFKSPPKPDDIDKSFEFD